MIYSYETHLYAMLNQVAYWVTLLLNSVKIIMIKRLAHDLKAKEYYLSIMLVEVRDVITEKSAHYEILMGNPGPDPDPDPNTPVPLDPPVGNPKPKDPPETEKHF